MLASITNEHQRFFPAPFPDDIEETTAVSLSTGTAVALVAHDGDWQEIPAIDLSSGHYTVYASGREFLAAMDEIIARNEARSG
jgi:hypothetical protein